MAITTAITKPLDKGFVQVNSTEKNGYKRYYKVPEKNAEIFAENLKKQDKKLNLYSNLTFFTSIFAGVLGASIFTKNIEGMKKFFIQTGSGIIAAALSSLGFNKYAENKEKAFLKENNAKEIFYRA